MKRLINSKSITLLVPLCALLAVALRFWTRGSGPDEAGLFPSMPLAWGLLWLLTAATTAATLFAVWGLQNPGTYRDNYPRSIVAGLCTVPAAIIFLASGFTQSHGSIGGELPGNTIVDTVTGIVGILAGVCLLISALHRALGKKPFFLINGVVCLYLAFRLFNCCRSWSNEPQLNMVVFPFLASTALMLAAYHRVCFDVNMANRRWAAFWSLMSSYLCVVAMISFEQPLFYGFAAVWQMANLCSMRPLKRRPQPVIQEAQEPQSDGETQTPETEETQCTGETQTPEAEV